MCIQNNKNNTEFNRKDIFFHYIDQLLSRSHWAVLKSEKPTKHETNINLCPALTQVLRVHEAAMFLGTHTAH
jgi:hypothetical protein